MYTNEVIRKKLRSAILTVVLILLISTVFTVPVFAATKLDNPISGGGTVMVVAPVTC
jgi:hypothetical protein